MTQKENFETKDNCDSIEAARKIAAEIVKIISSKIADESHIECCVKELSGKVYVELSIKYDVWHNQYSRYIEKKKQRDTDFNSYAAEQLEPPIFGFIVWEFNENSGVSDNQQFLETMLAKLREVVNQQIDAA